VTPEEKSRDKGAVTISLLGREFRVGCPEGEEKQLAASVDYLNRKLKEVRDTGKVVGNERIAIMAALNIAHEFMSNHGKAGSGAAAYDAAALKRRILALQETLDAALEADQENLF
jgi:cell division protein ZapA